MQQKLKQYKLKIVDNQKCQVKNKTKQKPSTSMLFSDVGITCNLDNYLIFNEQ